MPVSVRAVIEDMVTAHDRVHGESETPVLLPVPLGRGHGGDVAQRSRQRISRVLRDERVEDVRVERLRTLHVTIAKSGDGL